MKGPTFICPGAQKAGTTWLHRQLAAHPQFWMPPQKEIDYLAHMPTSREKYAKRLPVVSERLTSLGRPKKLEWWNQFCEPWSLDKYPKLFANAGRKFSGDVSPNYSMLSREEVQRATTVTPNSKIILLLRNPVERAWSHARHSIFKSDKANLPEQERNTAIEQFAMTNRCYRYTDYVRILTDWSDAYGAENVFVGYYDDLQNRPLELLNNILKFVGADPTSPEREPFVTDVSNRGVEVPCPPELYEQLSQKMAPMVQELALLLPAGDRPEWARPTSDKKNT